MGLKREILLRLQDIQSELARFVIVDQSMVQLLREELRSQREENQRLRDAFMAQDFEKFKTYRIESKDERLPEREFAEDEIDQNAGEVLTGIGLPVDVRNSNQTRG